MSAAMAERRTVAERLALMGCCARPDGMEHPVPIWAGEECAATAIVIAQDENDPSVLVDAFFDAQCRGGKFFGGFLGLVARQAMANNFAINCE